MTWEWLAGFFDGEGTARLPLGTSKSISPQWQIVQAGKRGHKILSEIEQFIKSEGVASCTFYSRRPDYPGEHIKSRLECWVLLVCKREEVEMLYRKLLPFLRVKKIEVQDILRYCKLYPRLDRGEVWKFINKEIGQRRRKSQGEAITANKKAYSLQYYAAHRDKMRAYQRAWRLRAKLSKTA